MDQTPDRNAVKRAFPESESIAQASIGRPVVAITMTDGLTREAGRIDKRIGLFYVKTGTLPCIYFAFIAPYKRHGLTANISDAARHVFGGAKFGGANIEQ